jgi:hypothetical protein
MATDTYDVTSRIPTHASGTHRMRAAALDGGEVVQTLQRLGSLRTNPA